MATPLTAYLFCYNDEDKEKEIPPGRQEFKKNCVQAVRNVCKYMLYHVRTIIFVIPGPTYNTKPLAIMNARNLDGVGVQVNVQY